jgi:hypothetical protein
MQDIRDYLTPCMYRDIMKILKPWSHTLEIPQFSFLYCQVIIHAYDKEER